MISETFQPIDENIDFDAAASYAEVQLVMHTQNARIYRAVRAGKRVILKAPVDDSAMRLDLLKREYMLAVGLDHHNVASVYVWEPLSPVGPAIVMEYVDGRTLADYLAEQPSRNERIRVFAQLLDAVDYIHKHGVTHNDLKTENIMVSRANNDVKIIDFGLADDDSQISQRMLGCTRGYASPELQGRDSKADTRSDIYSIGVIMGEIFPKTFRWVQHRCLATNPGKRYRNIEQLRLAWKRRRRMPMLAGAVAILIVVVSALLFAGHRISTRQAAYSDSICVLQEQIALRDHEKFLEDSLTDQYFAIGRTFIAQYCDDLRDFGCMEANLYLNPRFMATIDSLDSEFATQNGDMGAKIIQLHSTTIRIEGLNAAQSVLLELPLLFDLIPDVQNYNHNLNLISTGHKIPINKGK